jgi:hypothetical protein
LNRVPYVTEGAELSSFKGCRVTWVVWVAGVARVTGVETFEKCSILVKVKEGENFNHRNILNISRIGI